MLVLFASKDISKSQGSTKPEVLVKARRPYSFIFILFIAYQNEYKLHTD